MTNGGLEKVVVTGGAGFIGANLCRALVEAGAREVVVVDDLSTGNTENLAGLGGVKLLETSVLDAPSLDSALVGASSVVHLAARPSVPRSLKDPQATHEVNATGTLLLLEAARRSGNPHVVVASSSSVYGANPVLPKREDLRPSPMNPYAASKLSAEAYALAYRASFGLDVLVFRLFNVFGPYQPAGHPYAAVIPAFISAALEDRPLTLHGTGRQTRDFTYVGNVTSAIVAALRRRTTSEEPVNLAFGTRTSLIDLVECLEVVFGRHLPVCHVEPRPTDVPHSQADPSRLRHLFPHLEPTPLDEGLLSATEWLRAGGDCRA